MANEKFEGHGDLVLFSEGHTISAFSSVIILKALNHSHHKSFTTNENIIIPVNCRHALSTDETGNKVNQGRFILTQDDKTEQNVGLVLSTINIRPSRLNGLHLRIP